MKFHFFHRMGIVIFIVVLNFSLLKGTKISRQRNGSLIIEHKYATVYHNRLIHLN